MANLLKQAQAAAAIKPARIPVHYMTAPADPTQVVAMLPADPPDALTRHAWWVAEETQTQRQAIEDARAIYRNRNRFLTLGFALVISLVLTFVFTHGYLGPLGVSLAPYSFVITIALDSLLTLYAYIRRY
jgi:hypothetical protein